MKLTLTRVSSDKESTLGLLDIAGAYQCVTVEDQKQLGPKVHGETRIPAGTYDIKLRTVGSFHDRYKRKFGDWHQGMLWLQDVPGFEYILIHTGNTEADSSGCIIVGTRAIKNGKGGGTVTESVKAYQALYPKVRDAILRGEDVTITIIDKDGK